MKNGKITPLIIIVLIFVVPVVYKCYTGYKQLQAQEQEYAVVEVVIDVNSIATEKDPTIGSIEKMFDSIKVLNESHIHKEDNIDSFLLAKTIKIPLLPQAPKTTVSVTPTQKQKAEEWEYLRPQINYFGIMNSKGKKLAVIEATLQDNVPIKFSGTILQGKTIFGWKLKEINPDNIVLTGNKTKLIVVKNGYDKKSFTDPLTYNKKTSFNNFQGNGSYTAEGNMIIENLTASEQTITNHINNLNNNANMGSQLPLENLPTPQGPAQPFTDNSDSYQPNPGNLTNPGIDPLNPGTLDPNTGTAIATLETYSGPLIQQGNMIAPTGGANNNTENDILNNTTDDDLSNSTTEKLFIDPVPPERDNDVSIKPPIMHSFDKQPQENLSIENLPTDESDLSADESDLSTDESDLSTEEMFEVGD